MTADLDQRVSVAPAYLFRPPRARSLVEQVTKVCASVGRYLDDEQQLAVDVLTGLKADGTPAALEGAVISARQNLKTFVLEGIALTLLLDPHNRAKLGIWSAQEFDTAQETFRNFVELFESDDYPHLSRRVKAIHRGSGKEEIELHGGRRLKFKARSGKGARGLTGDFVVLDEAFALDATHMGALLPTLSTRRRAMIFYGSSAGQMGSEVLRGVRDRGRAGRRGSPAYVEWCAPGSWSRPGCTATDCRHEPGTTGCALDREDLWRLANPAMGRRISADYIRAERLALTSAPAEFARERLGWWDDPSGRLGDRIPAGAWAACLDPDSAIVGPAVFCVEVSWDRSYSAITAAGFTAAGLPAVEVVKYDPGTEWVVPWLTERRATTRCVVVDRTSPAGSLLPEMTGPTAALNLKIAGARDLAQACGALFDAVVTEQLRHRGQTHLDVALAAASTRQLGDVWVWDRKGSPLDIAPITAATLALWGLSTSADQPFFGSWR